METPVSITFNQGFVLFLGEIVLYEDDYHAGEGSLFFVLFCLKKEERDELFKKISEYLPRFPTFSKTKKLEIILYGFNLSNTEPDPRNISVTFAVQKYIMKTKRFYPSSPSPSPPALST